MRDSNIKIFSCLITVGLIASGIATVVVANSSSVLASRLVDKHADNSTAALDVAAPFNSSKAILSYLPGFFRFTWESVKVPQQANMGLLGSSYFVQFSSWFYAGASVYGAVSGKQPGLFTLGGELGIRHPIYKQLGFNAGSFIGGGGRMPTVVGDGLMWRPYAGLLWSWQAAEIGVDYSYVTFPLHGSIHSAQLAAHLNLPAGFYYSSTNWLGNFSSLNAVDSPFDSISFTRNEIALLQQTYFLTSNATTQGSRQAQQLLGFELAHYFAQHWFGLMQASAVYTGTNQAGYMQALWGVGYSHFLTERLEALAQIAAGPGGGGNLNTGGGFIVTPTAGVRFYLTHSLALHVGAGYVAAPSGRLRAATVNAQLDYMLGWAKAGSKGEIENATPPYFFNHWRLRLLNNTYFQPQRAANSVAATANSNIQLAGFQTDLFLRNNWYLTAQTAFAYNGQQAGGLAAGLVGGGWSSPAWHRVSLYSELKLGAAGGGHLALGEGAVIQPEAGIQGQFNSYWGWQVSGAWLKSLNSEVSTPVLTVGVVCRFASLNN